MDRRRSAPIPSATAFACSSANRNSAREPAGFALLASSSRTAHEGKGGRLSAAYKSREETPKEGMCGQTCTTQNQPNAAPQQLQELLFHQTSKSSTNGRSTSAKAIAPRSRVHPPWMKPT